MNPRRRIKELLLPLILACVLVTLAGSSCFANGFPTRGIKEVESIPTPGSGFFGALNIRNESHRSWLCDLGNGMAVGVIPWNSKASADYWDYTTEYLIFQLPDTVCPDKTVNAENIRNIKPLHTARLVSHSPVSALRLMQSDRDLTVTAGGGQRLQLPWPGQWKMLDTCSVIRIWTADTKAKISIDNRFEAYPEAVVHEGLGEFVPQDLTSGAKDDHTGYWSYLDRVTPKSGRTVVGGRYRLAVIKDKDDPGTLLLVYIDGAEINADMWKTGDLKGILRPTSFENHYDLEWYDSHRLPAGMNECSATFEGINLLTLDFPLSGAQIRFQREME